MKKVAVINDLSGFGKCSLTAAIPVLSAMGVQCCPLPTAVLTGQTGYKYYHCLDLTDMVPNYIDAWKKNDVTFDAIYTGYVTGNEQLTKIFQFVDEFRTDKTYFVVDPVMGDDGRVYSMFNEQLLEGMKVLSRKANLITPNLTEACLLSDSDVQRVICLGKKADLLPVAEEIGHNLRALAKEENGVEQDVVITGIKCRDDAFVYNLAVTANGVELSKSHFFDVSFSGTGDLFASVMTGAKMRGLSTKSAMDLAGKFIYHSIADTMNEELEPMAGVHFEEYLIELIKGVESHGKE